MPVNFATVAERDAAAGPAGTTNYSNATAGLPGGTANVLTGTGNHASSDAPFGIEDGYIFNAVLNAGKTVRNYGFLVNNIGSIGTSAAPVDRSVRRRHHPGGAARPGAGPARPTSTSAATTRTIRTCGATTNGSGSSTSTSPTATCPACRWCASATITWVASAPHSAASTRRKRSRPTATWRLGLIVEAVANSRYANDTLIIVTEDDVQDGPDHVDSHRGTAFVVGPYVKKGAVISTRYSQVNALRTIEDILGTEHINLNTAFQRPMDDVFDIRSSGSGATRRKRRRCSQDTQRSRASMASP